MVEHGTVRFWARLSKCSTAAGVGRLLPGVPELQAKALCDRGGTSVLTVSCGVVTRYTGSTVCSHARVWCSQHWEEVMELQDVCSVFLACGVAAVPEVQLTSRAHAARRGERWLPVQRDVG